VQGLFPDAEVAAGVEVRWRTAASGPTLAYARAKELYNRAPFPTLEAQLEESRQKHLPVRGRPGFPGGDPAFLDSGPRGSKADNRAG